MIGVILLIIIALVVILAIWFLVKIIKWVVIFGLLAAIFIILVALGIIPCII